MKETGIRIVAALCAIGLPLVACASDETFDQGLFGKSGAPASGSSVWSVSSMPIFFRKLSCSGVPAARAMRAVPILEE